MRAIVVGLAVLVIGCSDPVADAKRRFEIVQRTEDKDEICRQAKQVAEELLTQAREAEYRDAKVTADIYCQNASLQ